MTKLQQLELEQKLARKEARILDLEQYIVELQASVHEMIKLSDRNHEAWNKTKDLLNEF